MSAFKGFNREFFRFFDELARNNNRDWFTANKERYTREVVVPIGQFIEAIAPRLKSISAEYVADPRPHGGSMFRIYRDTRFSNDKTPYKTHAACHFRHRAGKDAHAPGFYAHFETGKVLLGGGIWRPPGPALARIREFIVDNPAEWSKIRSARSVVQRGGIQGESLARAPRGFDPEHRHVEDLKRKSLYIMEQGDPGLLRSVDLVNRAAAAFRAAGRLNHFVCDALELPF